MPVDSKPRGPGQSNLSRAERQYRGKIATAKRYGRDTSVLRSAFDELQATRQLREAAERLVAARRAQGLPDGVEDPATLARIAALLIGSKVPS